MSAPGVKVFLADEDPLLLCSMRDTLCGEGYTVEAFERSEALLSRLFSCVDHRGCAVLDLGMPGFDGLDLLCALCVRGIALPLIFTSGQTDVSMVVTAIKRGAVDFLLKPIAPDVLCAAVSEALRASGDIGAKHSEREHALARWRCLSQREREVCLHSARGLLNKQIAAELGTAESTVQAQRKSAMKKLGIGSVADLVRLVSQLGDRKG